MNEPDRLSGLRAANVAKQEARLQRMVDLAQFANEARSVGTDVIAPKTGPGMKSKEIARDFIKKHPLPAGEGRGDGYAGALRMLIELEKMGLVRRRF